LFLVAASLLVLAVSVYSSTPVRLAIRANGPVQEGKPVKLEGMLDFQGVQVDQPYVIESWEWDLDGDKIFGEQGSEAKRGTEVGRRVTLQPTQLAGASTLIVHAQAAIRIGSELLHLAGEHELFVSNVRPEAIVAEVFETIGSSVVVSASCRDPGEDLTSVEWDLDNDGLFGEEGHDALSGDEKGDSVRFTTLVDHESERSVRVRVLCRDAEGAASKIQSSTVRVPVLQRSCVCALPTPVPFKQFPLIQSASFDKKDHSKIILTSDSVPSQGAVFHPTAITITPSGIEVCARYRMDNYDPSTAPASDAGSLSLVFTPEVPAASQDLAHGIISLNAASGITIRFTNKQPTILLQSTVASSSEQHVVGYSTTNRQDHFISMRFRNQRVTVWIDGIEALDEEFDLFPASIFGSSAHIGFVAQNSASFLQQLSVDAAIRSCAVADL